MGTKLLLAAAITVVSAFAPTCASAREVGGSEVLASQVRASTSVTAAHYSRSTVFHSNGYSYRISLSITAGRPVMGNSTSLPPGQYAIDVPVSARITVTNLTPGRDAPVPLPIEGSPVDALWKMPTPLCPANASYMGGTPDALHELIGKTWYCLGLILVDIQGNTSVSTLGVGRSVSQRLGATGCQSATVNNFSCPTGAPASDDIIIASGASRKAALRTLAGKPAAVLAYWSYGKFSSKYDVCTPGGDASGYGAWSWVISSTSHLPTGNCAG